MFWPEMIQPITSNVNFMTTSDKKLKLSCNTEGASIGYQKGDKIGSKQWKLYSEPIKVSNEKIVARAIRIGYKASEIKSNIN